MAMLVKSALFEIYTPFLYYSHRHRWDLPPEVLYIKYRNTIVVSLNHIAQAFQILFLCSFVGYTSSYLWTKNGIDVYANNREKE